MNSTLRILANRRSVRNYDEKPITTTEREYIINSALRAPTAGNMMLYSILEITDPSIKKKLVHTCDNQEFIGKAPLVLIFTADMQRLYDYYEYCNVPEFCRENSIDYTLPQESELFLANCDALFAAQNAVIAAESLGIGSCYTADIAEHIETHRKILNLPEYVFPSILICFGHRRESQKSQPLTTRFQQKYIVFENSYNRLSHNEFSDMFKERELSLKEHFGKVRNLGQHVYLKTANAPYSKERRRSVREILKNWQRGD